MMNISGFGLVVNLVASRTFPSGIIVTEFADDTDPLDSPDLQLADTSMGLNGDLIVWSRPQGIEVALAVIPTSESDLNLQAIFDANRVGKNKSGARDTIEMVVSYPSGEKAMASQGVMTVGTALPAVVSAGRFRTRTYRFTFESISRRRGTE